jgi:hypothetical protein
MRTLFRIDALLRQHQSLHWLSADNVRFDDLVDVLRLHSSVPHRIGIDDHRLPVLALVETSGFVRADFALEPALGDLVLEQFLEFGLACGIAASAGTAGIPLVCTDKHMPLILRHITNFNQYR